VAEALNGMQSSPISSANIDETIASTELHATSEALNMLSHAAQLDSYATSGHPHVADPPNSGISPLNQSDNEASRNNAGFTTGLLNYELVSRGLLTTSQVAHLVARYVIC
jgi:hypothetical protein